VFNRVFLLKLVKETVVTFAGTLAASLGLMTGDLSKASLFAAVAAAARAVVGVLVKNVGEANSPHL